MSCPSCQVGGRRMPALPLGYINKSKKKWNYEQFKSLGTMEFASSFHLKHVGSTKIRSYSQHAPLIEDHSSFQDYLLSNPNIIEDFVSKHISQEQIERWLIRKTKANQPNQRVASGGASNNKSLSKWKFCVHKDKRKLLENLTSKICEKKNKGYVLKELAKSIAQAVHATRYNLYFVDESGKHLIANNTEQTESGGHANAIDIESSQTVSSYVARTNEVVYVQEIIGDDRFPAGTGKNSTDQSIICHPIPHPNSSKIFGIIEFVNDAIAGPFAEEDFEIVCSYISWGTIAIHYAEIAQQVTAQAKMEKFAAEGARLLLTNKDFALEVTLRSIMELAKEACGNEHYVVFERKEASSEIYSTITNIVANNDTKKNVELRFPSNKGVAGHVFSTNQKVIFVQDAYSDPYFLRETDQKTSLTTKTILAAPVVYNEKVVYVLQLVNKTEGYFNQQDESVLQLCSLYCTLAIENGKQKELLKLKASEVDLLKELLQYHGKPRDKDLLRLANSLTVNIVPDDFYSFSFNYYDNPSECASWFLVMAKDMFNKCEVQYNEKTLLRFTLTVRKHYRTEPYHNWEHAFSVAHFMYLLLDKIPDKFTKLEKLALFIGCICHDLDHRARNNAFVRHTNSPLSVLYKNGSCLERHHFYMTQHILQQEAYNVFECLDEEKTTQVYDVMEEAILATDLFLHFNYRDTLNELHESGTFSWETIKNRKLASFCMMTISDLCGSCKPWEVHCISVAKVFEEFYGQADDEIAMGIQPIPMFVNKEDLPFNQIGFLNAIVMPCLNVLKPIIPSLASIEENILDSVSHWENIIKHEEEDNDDVTRQGTPVEQKLLQLKVPGSKIREKSLSFVRYNCSGMVQIKVDDAN